MAWFDTEEDKQVFNVEYKKMKEEGYPFHPFATWKDVTVGLLVLVILVALSAIRGVHMDAPADPTSSYLPRPEWYFMWLFQLLKYFPGWTAIFAVAIIPGALGAILVLLPFFDRNPYRSPAKRPVATALMSAGILGIVALTFLAYYQDWKEHPGGHAAPGGETHAVAPATTAGGNADGKEVFESTCKMCHGATGTQIPGVSLFSKDFLKDKDVVAIVTNGTDKGMPSFKAQFTEDQIKAVAEYLKENAK